MSTLPATLHERLKQAGRSGTAATCRRAGICGSQAASGDLAEQPKEED